MTDKQTTPKVGAPAPKVLPGKGTVKDKKTATAGGLAQRTPKKK